jgi:hypothetical protein
MDLETHKRQYVDIETQKSVHKRELVALNKEQKVHHEAIIEAMEHEELSVMDCGDGFTITRKSRVPDPSAKDLIQLLTDDQKETVKGMPRSPKITFVAAQKKRKHKSTVE